jgi:SecD/SecF fusion protein
MKKQFIKNITILLLVTIFIIFTFIPLFKKINYGLDLKGGFEVLYKVTPLEGSKLTSDMLKGTYNAIDKRINNLGVNEPDISIEGKDRIRVKLAGITDKDKARETIGRTAVLSFRDTNDNLLMTSDVLKAGGVKAVTSSKSGLPVVSLAIKDKDKFYDVTNKVKDYTDNRIVIWLDFEEGTDSYQKEASKCGSLSNSKCLSSARVSQAFASDVTIEGNFTQEEASSLAAMIKSGSMPTKLTEISSKTVGALFGENSLNQTLIAGIIAIALIIIFMTAIYRFAGFISGIGMIIYTYLVFIAFWLINGVLTLPGIASLVLGIGMAIDACVLSFERIKEELWQGKSLSAAFDAGYKRSFVSILDSNLTTLIVAIVLFILGESSVKGFATMLIISIVITIFVMVFVIKYILKIFIKTKFFDKKTNLFVSVKSKDIPNISKNEKPKEDRRFIWADFLKRRSWYLIGSSSLIVIGIIFTIINGLNLSVDYKGGTEITLNTKNQISVNQIKMDMNTLGYKYNSIEKINDATMYIKIDDVLNKDKINSTENYFNQKYNASTEVGVVSNVVKKELTVNAIYAVIISFIGIIIYVAFRFSLSYGVAAIVALVHDCLIVFTIFSLFHIEVSVIFIAAILTIIGYSINDTVVIYDRIRENLKNWFSNKEPNKKELYDTINSSIRTTMTRSIYTVITVLITVICLIILGTRDIINFNLAMLFGLISGAYSTIFIAPPLVYEMEKNNLGKDNTKKKKVIKDELDEWEIKGINS